MDKKSVLFICFMICILLSAIIYVNKIQKDLKANGVIVQTKILRVNYGGKVGGGFQCQIVYNGKVIERPSRSSIKKARSIFVGKTFPGMYSPNTNKLEVLIAPTDFNKFNINFPDSLNWVIQYVLE